MPFSVSDPTPLCISPLALVSFCTIHPPPKVSSSSINFMKSKGYVVVG